MRHITYPFRLLGLVGSWVVGASSARRARPRLFVFLLGGQSFPLRRRGVSSPPLARAPSPRPSPGPRRGRRQRRSGASAHDTRSAPPPLIRLGDEPQFIRRRPVAAGVNVGRSRTLPPAARAFSASSSSALRRPLFAPPVFSRPPPSRRRFQHSALLPPLSSRYRKPAARHPRVVLLRGSSGPVMMAYMIVCSLCPSNGYRRSTAPSAPRTSARPPSRSPPGSQELRRRPRQRPPVRVDPGDEARAAPAPFQRPKSHTLHRTVAPPPPPPRSRLGRQHVVAGRSANRFEVSTPSRAPRPGRTRPSAERSARASARGGTGATAARARAR